VDSLDGLVRLLQNVWENHDAAVVLVSWHWLRFWFGRSSSV
jgi:hypothetical protein